MLLTHNVLGGGGVLLITALNLEYGTLKKKLDVNWREIHCSER